MRPGVRRRMAADDARAVFNGTVDGSAVFDTTIGAKGTDDAAGGNGADSRSWCRS